MKSLAWVLISAFLFCTAAQALTMDVLPRLPPADTLDTEVVTNSVLRLARNQLIVSLELDATETNNVEVAFGLDVNTDGTLDPDEELCALGWDCGAWFITDRITGDAILNVPRDAGRRKLIITLDFARDGSLRQLEATDGSDTLTMQMKPSKTLLRQNVNLMRLTARGKGQHLEHIEITNKQIGIAFLVK